MYIKTPRKYRGTSRRSVFPMRRILFSLFLIGLIALGVFIYVNRETVAPVVNAYVSTAVADAEIRVSTMTAPTATPTPDPRNNLVQADNFWSQGAVSDALALYRSILPGVPNDVGVYGRVTLSLIAQGDYLAAVEMGEHTVTANPYSSDAWAVRAWALDWAGRYGEAIASALHARELDPNNPRALAYLAEAYFSNGQTERALSTAEQAIELDPDSPEAYRARAIVYWQGTFDLPAAIADMQTAYQLAQESNPAIASVLATDIANLEIAQGNVQGAISMLDSVLETNPQNTQALYSIGSIYLREEGNPEVANNYFLRCVDINPESTGCHYMLGRTQDRLDQLQSAADSFARAIELGSTDPYHLWWAGRSQISLGNCATALEYLEEGYNIAIANENETLVGDYEAILPLCDADFGPSEPVTEPEIPELETPSVPDDGEAANTT